jgi:uncharacterized protein YegL
VLVIGRHLAMQGHLDAVKAAARDAVQAIEFGPDTRAGVISLSAQATSELELTDSKSKVLSTIAGIQLDPINPFTRYYDWLGRAQAMLEEARTGISPIEVIALYSTGCPDGFEQYCSRQLASANRAQGAGMTVIGVCNPQARPFGFPLPASHCRDIQQMASRGHYFTLQQARGVGQDVVDLVATASRLSLQTLALTEELAPDWRLVVGSTVPPVRQAGQQLSYEWTGLQPGDTVSMTYVAQPGAMGQLALRTTRSEVRLVDSLDRGSDPIALPARNLTVTDCPAATESPMPIPTATPSPTRLPPTSMPTAIQPTPEPTPEPTLRAHLPLVLSRVCTRAQVPSDIVLAIDSSSSMNETSGSTTKIEAARQAASYFVQLMDLGRDQAALVTFNAGAQVPVPLTTDRDRLLTAIGGIQTGAGTRIDHALEAVSTEFSSPRARSGARWVTVLMTDGRPADGTLDATLSAAARLRQRAVTVYAVGLGDDADEAVLRQIAGEPSRYLYAPDASALRSVHEDIAAQLPCPSLLPATGG